MERVRLPPAEEPVVRLTLAPVSPSEAHPREVHRVEARERFSNPDISSLATLPILPDLSPESAPVPSEPKLVEPSPDVIAPPIRLGMTHDRAGRAMARLKDKLTPTMLRHFGLILYVSNARSGPLGQRMLVVENRHGLLKPIHDWMVSTGREQDEISPRGRSSFTATPKGFYELDPDRMYRSYRSWNWDQDMPYAMFFNWKRRGVETGLAIHAALGSDIDKLGGRASAGCVHLAPEHAALLYHMIRRDYAGPVPRFAFNDATETMSNSGHFMRGRGGRLKMADGYQVLVVIDDYMGDDRLAGLDGSSAFLMRGL